MPKDKPTPVNTYEYTEAETNDGTGRLAILNHYGARGWRLMREAVRGRVHHFTFVREGQPATSAEATPQIKREHLAMPRSFDKDPWCPTQLQNKLYDLRSELQVGSESLAGGVSNARILEWIRKIDDIMNPKPESEGDGEHS